MIGKIFKAGFLSIWICILKGWRLDPERCIRILGIFEMRLISFLSFGCFSIDRSIFLLHARCKAYTYGLPKKLYVLLYSKLRARAFLVDDAFGTLVGVPKVKSAFATSATRPKAKTNTIVIFFFILLPFQKLLVFSGYWNSLVLLLWTGKREETNVSIESFFKNWYNLFNIAVVSTG